MIFTISHFYTNRSAVFAKLRMGREGLADIELAKKERLPERLLPKLEERRKKCVELVQLMRHEPEYVPELDYKADKNYPPLANVVEIQTNQDYGRHLVATSDIPKGRTILLEESSAISSIRDSSICYTCYRSMYSNFIACDHCINVMYCSVECKNRNKTHALECGTFFGMKHFDDKTAQKNLNRTKVVIQTILNALTTFANVEVLMRFIDNVVRGASGDIDKLPTAMNDPISKYHFFFKLKKRVRRRAFSELKKVYTCILFLPKIRDMFDTVEKKRFLMHLVVCHTLIVDSNAQDIDETLALRNVFSIFNHQCVPNIKVNTLGKLVYCQAARPIKKGEQLFINYLTPEELEVEDEERKQKIKWTYGFECQCEKCEKCGKTV